MEGVFVSRRENDLGGVWVGRATVETVKGEVRVHDVGAWDFAGQKVKGEQRLRVGDGVFEVATPHEVHGYAVKASAEGEWDFEGRYVCGQDVYEVWFETPQKNGWRLKMRVKGPYKDDTQVVNYSKFEGVA